MMKPYRYIRSLILAFAVLSLSACSNDDYLLQTEGENVSITFHPTLGGELSTRTIGDATGIDRLTVAVYEGSQTLSKKFSFSEEWDIVKRNGIALTVIEGRSYKILFWAENSENSAYTITDDGRITVNYDNYINGGFAKMEEMDVFFGISSITVGTQKVENKGEIKLSRPLAQVNFADNTTKPILGTHKAIVTYHGLPTSFNPFTGEIRMSENDITFTFEDFPDETLSVNVSDNEYYYISSNYVFAPQAETTATIRATLDLQNIDGTSIKIVELDDITIEQNKKTNILGSIVQEPETWSVWNGTIPTVSTLTTDPENQNRYIIDEADDVAWLSVKENAQSLATNSTFVMTVDVDMNNGSGLAAIQLPSGSTLDGDGHTIKGLKLGNALLGDVTDITVKNLNIEETTVENTSTDVTHVGVLVNTLKGSNTFSNIHIKSSSVSTQNGAAGGIVGYISRKDPNNREEELTVIFDDCHVTETTVDGTRSEGHFVGLLRGYDNKETLQFNSNCTLTLSATARSADDFVSPYREGNEGAWLASNDYSKYDGWLGNEECYRGTVMYGGNRFIPCWDGVTKITPLTDGTTKLIYSAFDLASLQEATGIQITFKSDVDMGTKVFEPIMTATKVYGKRDDSDGNYVIYNLKVDTEFLSVPWYGGAFIRKMASGSVENITIKDANVSVTNAEGGEDAYASILVATIEGSSTVTIKNVTVEGGYLKGINKIGGIAGYVSCNLQATNCIVNGLTIENFTTSNTGDVFESYGEIGGLIGFIQGNGSVISQCQVNNSTLNVKASTLRYNNRFIGTANPSSGQKITIQTNCSATGNKVTNESRLKYGGFFGIGGKTFDLLGGYSLSVLQGGDVYYGNTKLK